MNRIIYYNRNNCESYTLETAVEEQLSCLSEAVASDADLLKSLEFKNYSLILVHFKNFGLIELNLVNSIRGKYSTPILVVAENNSFPDFFTLEKQGKTHIIYDNPIDVEHFIGLASKLLSTKKANPQVFRRYNTDQSVDLEILQEGETILSKLCNLSLGGAYCEFVCDETKLDKLRNGDLVRINVPKSEKGFHQMNARIVWRKKQQRKDVMGVGLKFVKLQEL